MYAKLIEEAGPLADKSEARSHVDSILSRASSGPKGSRKAPTRGMTAAQARRVAVDLTAYDGKIKGGRLTGGE